MTPTVTAVRAGQLATFEASDGSVGWSRRPVPADGLLVETDITTVFIDAYTVRAKLRAQMRPSRGLRVPFRNGSLMEYVSGWENNIEWIDNEPFTQTLRYEGYHRGRSVVRMDFQGKESGRRYSMTLSAFDKIAHRMNDGAVSGRWCFAKQGANYGLYPFEGDE